MKLNKPILEYIVKEELNKLSEAPKYKPNQKISKQEWGKIKKFNKHIGKDGKHYVTQLTNKGTTLVPVVVEGNLNESNDQFMHILKMHGFKQHGRPWAGHYFFKGPHGFYATLNPKARYLDISKGDRSVHNDYAWTSLVRFFAKQGIKKIDEGKLSEGRKFKYKKNDWKKYNQLVKKGKSVMIQTAFGDEFAWEDGSNYGVFGSESDGREIELSHDDIDQIEVF